MTNMTFLVGSYYPDFSAVGYCAYQVQKCLAQDFSISVVSFRTRGEQPEDEVIEDARIFRVETDDMRRRSAALNAGGRLASTRFKLLRLWGAMRRLLSPVTIDRSLVRAYLDRLDQLDPKPDVLMPVVFPFESVLAALAYKAANPGVVLVPYLFDDFVESGSLHVLKLARAMKRSRHVGLERRMLAESDAILAMHPLRRHLEGNFDSILLRKVTFLEHPLLSPPTRAVQRYDDGIIRLCFTGSLIRKVREPGYLIDLLRALHVEEPVRADFFVMGNAAQDVSSGVLANGLEVVNHGRVSKSEADAAVGGADILINIGEATGRQVSSKVFEYMSTGKPILHLAMVETDTVTGILSRYPLALCLIEAPGQLEMNARKVSDFIRGRAVENLTFEQVKAIYPEALPSTTADVLREIAHPPHDSFETETAR